MSLIKSGEKCPRGEWCKIDDNNLEPQIGSKTCLDECEFNNTPSMVKSYYYFLKEINCSFRK